MQQFFIGLILVLGLGCWWLYSENETLKANNTKLEYAIEEQKQTIATIKESYEKQGQALMNMTKENALIEQEKAEYLQIFSRHNLDVLALKKPGMIELRMNNASEKVMEGIEDDTEKLYNIGNPSTD
jgi:antitoxin component YwqK of YwqJK toxin-antitoxin module